MPPQIYPNIFMFGSELKPAKDKKPTAKIANADSPNGPSMRATPVCTPNSPMYRVHHFVSWLTHP